MILTRPFRKPFWIISSFIKKHQRLILATTGLGAFLVLFTRNLIPFLPRPKPHLKIGLVGQYTLKTLPPSVVQTISRSLTKVDQQGQVSPDLAETWEVLEEETLYRFYLKPGLFWSDGSPLVSQDIHLDIPDVVTRYPNDKVIEFKLKEPFSPFLVTLSRPLFKKGTVGAGQYLIKKIRYQGRYLKTLQLASQENNLTYNFYPSHQSAWLGFKLGEVDRLENLFINPLNQTWLKKVNLKQKDNYNQYLAVLFNLNDQYLSNKSLRQALAYALENKNPAGKRALTPINPQSWAYNDQVKPYNYQPDQARELFDKFSQDASLSGQLNLTLGTSQSFLQLAESIQQSWQKTLDLQVTVKIVNSIEADYQALLIAQEIPLDPDQHALWHSTQSSNITHYSDLKVDKLLEDGRRISDLQKRQEIYQDFQRFLLEDSPAIFLMHPITYTISRH
jgi:peptide/nickel transport system substrate-binding protein